MDGRQTRAGRRVTHGVTPTAAFVRCAEGEGPQKWRRCDRAQRIRCEQSEPLVPTRSREPLRHADSHRIHTRHSKGGKWYADIPAGKNGRTNPAPMGTPQIMRLTNFVAPTRFPGEDPATFAAKSGARIYAYLDSDFRPRSSPAINPAGGHRCGQSRSAGRPGA